MDSSISSLSDVEITHHSFPFFDLPSELRRKIMIMHLQVDQVVDLDHRQYSRIASRIECFLVSRRFHEEAYPIFYGLNTFRLFPTHGQAKARRARPLISKISPRYRNALVLLELRLGPFWNNPPKSWKVSNSLGLKDLISLKTLKVFVQCDPSDPIFNGFRTSKHFYTDFAGDLLARILDYLPALNTIYFDGWPSVSCEAPLMTRLLDEARKGRKAVTLGSGLKDHDHAAITGVNTFFDGLVASIDTQWKISANNLTRNASSSQKGNALLE